MSYHVLYCRTWEMSSIDQNLWHGSRPSWALGVYMYVVLSLQWRNVKIFKKPILAHYKWETRGRMQPRGIRIVPVWLIGGFFFIMPIDRIQTQESRHFGYIGVVPVLWPWMRLRIVIWGINLLSCISICLFY